MMRIALIGRTEVLLKTGRLLIQKGYKIPLIITAKEAVEYKAGIDAFKKFAEEINADFLSTANINKTKALFEKHKDLDVGVSMNYSGIIPQWAIDFFKIGILNAHGGDLPRYRGNACQAWAILNGEDRIGLCIHKMIGDELDSGDIIARDYMPIDINTKVTFVWDWMEEKIPQLFIEAIENLNKNKNYYIEKQSKNPEDILRCYPITPEDGKIDWTKSNTEILRQVNAFAKPYNGAFCFYNGRKVKIWDAEIYKDDEKYCSFPGQIGSINKNDIIVICGSGKLKIKQVEFSETNETLPNIFKSIRMRLK